MPNMEDLCMHDLNVVAMCLLTSSVSSLLRLLYSNNGGCMDSLDQQERDSGTQHN